MRGCRRPIFRMLLGCGVLLSGWWLLTVPYQRGRLYTCIPARAAFVSVHRHLPDRLEAFAENPLAITLFSPAGMDSRALRDTFRDPAFHALADRLFRREVACAYVPAFGPRGTPAWILASWIGGRSQLYRWRLMLTNPPELERARTPSGRVYWIYRSEKLGEGRSLSLFLAEGILVGCISEDAQAIERAMDVVQGRRPSVALFRGAVEAAERCAVEGSPDHGWLNLAAWNTRTLWPHPLLWYQLETINRLEVIGRFCSPVSWLDVNPAGGPVDRAAFGRLFGDLPMALFASDTASAIGALGAAADTAWGSGVHDVLRRVGEGPLCVAAVGGEYGGRYLDLKVPGLLAAVQVSDPEQSRNVLLHYLDQLNAQYQWGLYPREVRVGERLLHVVESSQKNAFADLGAEERPAFTVCDNLLVAASSLGSLRALVARYDRQEAQEHAGRGAWLPGLTMRPLYAWFNVREFSKSLRTAIKLHQLKTRFKNPRAALPSSRDSDNLMAWLEALAGLSRGELWLASSNSVTELRFTMSAENE